MEKVWVLATEDGVLAVSRTQEACETVMNKLFDKLRLKRTTDLALENGVFTIVDRARLK